MDKEALLNRTRKDLRSVLISSPRGVAARLLFNDFKMVLGYELPYRQLGFKKLEDFIRTIPDVARLEPGVMGEPTYFAVADESTRQIARFVATQKKPKLKKSNAPPMVRKPLNMFPGFTKKARYGSRPPRAGPPPFRGGGRYGGPGGGVYTGDPYGGRQYNKPKSYRGPQMAPRFQQQQQPALKSDGRYKTSNFGPASPGYVSSSGTSNRQQQFRSDGSNKLDSNSSNMSGSGTNTHQQLKPSQSDPARSSASSSSQSNDSGSKGPGSKFEKSSSSDKTRRSTFPEVPTAGKSFSSRHWHSKDADIPVTEINELTEKPRNKQKEDHDKIVCVVGYVCGERRFDEPNNTVKYLLHSGYDKKKQHGIFPAVMLFFKQELCWNIEDKRQDFQNVAVGSRLKVYGNQNFLQNKKKNVWEPAIKVLHYSYEPEVASSPHHPVSSRSSSTSSFSSVAPSPASMPLEEVSSLVYKLLKAKPNGIWSKRLGKEIEAFHKINAPADIAAIAKTLPFVEIDNVNEDNPILRLNEKFSESPSESSSSTASFSSAQDEPVKASVKFTTQKPSLPGTVEFPETEQYFDVYVTYIDNPISFYLQRAGKDYLDELTAMEKKMGNRYSKSKLKPISGVKENELYGYHWEEQEADMWCRVLVNSVARDGKTANIYFPDYGNSEEEISMEDLKELPRDFYELPFQAVHCCLHGCTGVREEATELFIEHALDKSCVAQVMESSGTRISVELIDSETEGGETINSVIMAALHPVSTLFPKLPKPGEPRVAVILTDIDEDGIVTVQVCGPGVNQLQRLMTLINDKYKTSRAADFVPSMTLDSIYCTQFTVDKKFYRVKVKKAIPGKPLVEYIDYGNEEQTELKKLRKPLHDPLFDLPAQAVKCRLHGLPPPGKKWNDGATYLVAGYLDCEDLYLSVVEVGTEGELPSVNLIMSGGNEGEEEEVVLNELVLQRGFDSNAGSEEDNFSDNSSGLDMGTENPGHLTPRSPSTPLSPGKTDPINLGASTIPSDFASLPKPAESAQLDYIANNSANTASENHKNLYHTTSPDVSNVTSNSNAKNNHNSTVGPSPVKLTPSANNISKSLSPAAEPYTPGSSLNATPSNHSSLSGVSKSLSPAAEPYMPTSLLSNHSGYKKLSPGAGLYTPATSPSVTSISAVVSPSSSGQPFTPLMSPGSSSNPPTPSNSTLLYERMRASAFSPQTPTDSPPTSSGPPTPLRSSENVKVNNVDLNFDTEQPLPPDPDFKRDLSFAVLSSDQPEPVIVTWIQSPHNFVIQLYSQIEALEKMMMELNEALVSTSPISPHDVRSGLVCSGLSSIHQQWHRVLVLSVSTSPGGTNVNVEYLDYGGTEEVTVSMLKPLPEDFLKLPFQGLSCTLRGVESVDHSGSHEWSEEAKQWFTKRVEAKNFFAVQLNVDRNRNCITLLDTSGSSTDDVRDDLQMAGFAKLQK